MIKLGDLFGDVLKQTVLSEKASAEKTLVYGDVVQPETQRDVVVVPVVPTSATSAAETQVVVLEAQELGTTDGK